MPTARTMPGSADPDAARGVDRGGRTDDTTRAERFDLTQLPDEYYADPYPYYRALREHAPVKAMPDGSWFLTRYRDILPVYRDPHVWSSNKEREFGPKYGATN